MVLKSLNLIYEGQQVMSSEARKTEALHRTNQEPNGEQITVQCLSGHGEEWVEVIDYEIGAPYIKPSDRLNLITRVALSHTDIEYSPSYNTGSSTG